MEKDESMILFSYIPLLYPTAPLPEVKDLPKWIEEIEKDLPNVSGVHWAMTKGRVQAFFVVERSKEVFDHINYWSDSHPESWFTCGHQLFDDHFTFGLYPDLKKSAMRNDLQREMCDLELLSDKFIVAFPLVVSSVGTTFREHVLPWLVEHKQATIDIGFVDPGIQPSDGFPLLMGIKLGVVDDFWKNYGC